MTAEAFIALLDNTRQTSRGWVARCPAHADRHPSLSVSEGERGILVKCWAGCLLEDITVAVGIKVQDLFYDNEPDSLEWRDAHRRRSAERQREKEINVLVGLSVDTVREAERLIQSARDINIDRWSDVQLDVALNRLADAYDLLEKGLMYGGG